MDYDEFKELPNFHYLSNAKYGALVAVTIFSSLLSVCGSCLIVYLVVSKQKYTSSLFHRIFLCLSSADVVASISTMLQIFLVPASTGLPLAIGNTDTCKVVGVFFQFVVAVHFYSSFLSLYFMVTIRYSWNEEKATRILEPWIHVIAWGLPLAKCTIGLAIDAINPGFSLNVCFLGNYPPACNENPNFECRTNTKTIAWILWCLNIIHFLAVACGIVWTWLVYSKVRTLTRRSRRYVFRGSSENAVDEEYSKKMRAVAVQSVWYTLAFLNSFLMSLFATLIEDMHNSLEEVYKRKSDPLSDLSLFLLAIFFPSQGFFMAVIYLRPILVRWKRSDPERSWLWAFHQLLSGNPAPTVATDATRKEKASPEVLSVDKDETDDTNLRNQASDSSKRGKQTTS